MTLLEVAQDKIFYVCINNGNNSNNYNMLDFSASPATYDWIKYLDVINAQQRHSVTLSDATFLYNMIMHYDMTNSKHIFSFFKLKIDDGQASQQARNEYQDCSEVHSATLVNSRIYFLLN